MKRRVRTHPGEVLREEFLHPMGLSVHGLAQALRVPATRLDAIVKGRRAVTADTAVRLGRYFGTSPEFWLNLQSAFDLSLTLVRIGRTVRRDIRPHRAAA